MKKIFLVLIFMCFITCGCTKTSYSIKYPKLIQTEINKDLQAHIICIDGIEYIVYASGYEGYMSPHLTLDKFNNAKVIKCEVKE